jgi:hypothetical protein
LSSISVAIDANGGVIRKTITPALTNENTWRVPRLIVFANDSKSMKHATKAVIIPVRTVPAVGTPVFGFILPYILNNNPSCAIEKNILG